MKIKDKVLIVEDEQSISSFISMILTANGYDTIIVNTGEEALTMISSHCPDLIVLDLGLPDMDGLEVLRSVRKWSSLPIVVVKELWGPKAKNDNQILRVNMANIRRKIEENPGQPKYIFTEVGVGYRMREGD